MKKDIKILAIETSCDETAAAVIGEKDGKPVILSNIVNSQIDLHAKTGGVVPEVASRAHMENIVLAITEALLQAKHVCHSEPEFSGEESNAKSEHAALPRSFANAQDDILMDNSEAIKYLQNNITHIAVTNGPGLIGSLLVGFNAAKAIAYALDKPIIPVNHIEGHIYSAMPTFGAFDFPVLTLTVSGGHTSLTLMRNHGEYERIGGTIDDAAGEAFDKVAKLLGLGYPGGPVVSKLANQFRDKSEIRISKSETNSNVQDSKNKNNITIKQYNNEIIFPRPILNDGTFNFSFSGLKTSVLQYILNIKKERNLTDEDKMQICAAFEDAVVDVLVTKAMRAVEKFKPKAVVLAGGVAANTRLRSELADRIQITPACRQGRDNSIKFLPAPNNLTGDNAAMIGLAAFYHLQKGDMANWKDIEIDSNLELGSRS
ncbi:MAG: tRNA (adenosine(37)-N6)-threonylcarbamoyltransferase complex transferase subunit TsaD [Patescibacteria group bacterium]|nr:tRNA (adenosine(37)-N6)-threonylcarbamoyltransferase complex transferase subunit TsaD [Patescibacteria group bacterium]